jgi:hypothetical protein
VDPHARPSTAPRADGIGQTDTKGSSEGIAPPQLQQLDAGGVATLSLDWASRVRGELWLLAQAGMPVGLLERTAVDTRLCTVSEEWRGGVRRRPRRLGWHLYFKQVGEPALVYHPNTLRSGGRFVVAGRDRYRLRNSLLGGDWRLADVPGGEICRFRFQRRDPRHLRVQLAFVKPMLLVVVLAASEAILIHAEQPLGGTVGA